MSKPTLIQSLLNQPSQSYSIPVPVQYKQDYHSTKQEMFRIAADANTDKPRQQSPSKQLRSSQPTAYRRGTSRLSYNEFEILEPSEESDLDDLFFTPNTSPRTSMASSLLMFPTGRKPSRKSLRLSDASDIVPLGTTTPPTPVGSTTAHSRLMPVDQLPSTNNTASASPATAVLSTRTPSTTASSSHHSSAHNRHQNDAQNQRTTSLEPGGSSSRGTHQLESGNDKRKGKEGIKHTTRHGTVMLKPNTVVVPSTITAITQTQSVKSTTTSKRKSSQDTDLTKDIKRPVPPSVSTPTPTSNGIVVKATVTATTSSTTASAAIGSPHVLASRKSSKSRAHANQATAGSSKEKTKQDAVAEPEAPSAGKTKEKEQDPDTSTSNSRAKDRGKEKAKAISMPTTHGDGNVVTSEQSTNIPPKTTTPHTFSAFAPLPASSTTASTPPPEKTNGNGNGNGNGHDKPPLPPAGFYFPPPPLHSPQHKNSLNGSAAAYTYAHRQKGSSTTKPPPTLGGSSSIMMNMAALLEEDENEDGNTQMRKLRHTTNGIENAKGKGKGKEKRRSFDSLSSTSDSSHRSHSRPPPRSNGNSHSILDSNYSNVTSQTQTHSEGSTFRSPPKTLSSEVNSMSLSTPGELPSKGTQGYTSLVLPRAPLPLRSHSTSIRTASTSASGSQRKWFGKEGKVDLTRSGVAQTTMASVEVVRGLGRQQGQNGFGGKLLGMFGRKRSISASGRGDVGPRPIEGLGKAVDDTRIMNEAKGKAPTTAGVEGTVLGFTSYRKPPGYVPGNSVLVQVWAVGVDGVDGRLVGLRFGDHVWSRVREREVIGGGREEEGGVETEWEREREMGGNEENEEVDVSKSTPQENSNNRGLAGLGRSFSLRMSRTKQPPNRQDHQRVHGRQEPSRSYTDPSQAQQNTLPKQVQRPKVLEKKQKRVPYATHKAEVGYIPGRSFVGRVLECGWDVRDEVVRKGEWVIGLLDVKKSGALTEFIVVDRHRIHRVPHPLKVPQRGNGKAAEADASIDLSALTLEELALLPLCGIPAYRAVRTFIYAFSSLRDGVMASPTTGTPANDRGGVEFGGRRNSKLTTEHPQDRRRRVLVLRGHDGIGAMAVQILAKRGWKVSVHVPFSSSFASDSQSTTTKLMDAQEHDSFPRDIQERARDWGADEIIFDEEAGGGIDDGRIAAIRVIESLREDGDIFDAILDTVGGKEVREAGERLLRSAGGVEPMSPKTPNKAKGVGQFTTLVGDVPERPIPTAGDNFRAGLRSLRFGSNDGGTGYADAGNGDEGSADMKGNKVGYAWVSVAQDVDWEGEDIGDTLASVLRLALENGVRPVIGDDVANHHRVVPFEKAPYAFVDRGPLGHGRTVVVKVAG